MVRTTDRHFVVSLSRVELCGLAVLDVGFLVGLRLYLRLKGY